MGQKVLRILCIDVRLVSLRINVMSDCCEHAACPQEAGAWSPCRWIRDGRVAPKRQVEGNGRGWMRGMLHQEPQPGLFLTPGVLKAHKKYSNEAWEMQDQPAEVRDSVMQWSSGRCDLIFHETLETFGNVHHIRESPPSIRLCMSLMKQITILRSLSNREKRRERD